MLSETSKKIVEIIIDHLEKGDQNGIKEYGVSIDDVEDVKYNWNLEAMEEMADALKYQQKEIEFLKQRNKDLRQKTWYPVYEENLYLKQENNMLKVAIASVQEFTKQFT
jgi:FtsZ-binding cell division protein ZapB